MVKATVILALALIAGLYTATFVVERAQHAVAVHQRAAA